MQYDVPEYQNGELIAYCVPGINSERLIMQQYKTTNTAKNRDGQSRFSAMPEPAFRGTLATATISNNVSSSIFRFDRTN